MNFKKLFKCFFFIIIIIILYLGSVIYYENMDIENRERTQDLYNSS